MFSYHLFLDYKTILTEGCRLFLPSATNNIQKKGENIFVSGILLNCIVDHLLNIFS